jgi:tRNA pseudouridine55 synthase
MATEGLLVIDKPAGLTSHDVVQKVRRLLDLRRVGHGGTLDPDATGVLLVAVGQATRFFPYLSKEDKVYEGSIRLGFATDTYDASGRPASGECLDFPGPERLEIAMKSFEGEILQVPPPYSAKKLAGKPVYKLARANKEFSLKPSAVRVERFRPVGFRPPLVEFEARCSSGTYIRSLAHDLGRLLGCGAHLATLRRTSVGPYALRDAIPLGALEEAASRGEAGALLIPLELLLPGVPAAVVRPEAEVRVRNGLHLEPDHLAAAGPGAPAVPGDAPLFRVLSASGALLALARPSPGGDRILPFLVLS